MTTVKNLAASVAEAIADGDSALGKEIDVLAARVADLSHRLELVEAANAALATVNEGLAREIKLLERLTREPAAPKAATRKTQAGSDANSLPAFVRTAAPSKRKSRAATIKAAPITVAAP
jgi:hypothetical protein